MFKVTAIALLLTLGISLVGALGFLLISPKVFMIVFFLITGIQMFVGYPINKFLDQKQKALDVYSKLLTDQEVELQTAQNTKIECAYCCTMNSVQVHLNNDYRFECRNCGEISKVVVDTRSCRTTDLEEIPNIPDITIPVAGENDPELPRIGTA